MTNKIDINDPSIPVIGEQPKPRIWTRHIEPFVANDDQGSARLSPQADITPLEVLKLQELVFWCVTTPGGGGAIPDPLTNGRTAVIVRTMWREYILAQQLERHFEFSGMRSDQTTEGSA